MSLTVREVALGYGGNTVLEISSFNLGTGEIGAVIGLSGSGKSTLLRAIAGIKGIQQGEVLLNNEKIVPQKHLIGYIPQNYGLIPWFTVKKNILLPSRYRKKLKQLHKYETLLKELNIYHLEDRFPNYLSGGQKQRVAIARALLLEPELLIMDEPFSSLDPFSKEEARQTFLDVWKQNQVTTLLVSHDLYEVLYLSHKIILLSGTPGRVIEIINNPFFGVKDANDEEYKEILYHINRKIRGEGYEK